MHGTLMASDVRVLAKDHPDFLGALATPDTHEAAFPPVFLAVWSILTSYAAQVDRLFKYFALGLPRGFGKTSLVKLLILWIILFTKRRFILVLAENKEKAQHIISDIFDMLDEPNIKRAFGDWRLGVEQDTLGLKQFSFRGRVVVVAGLGVNGSVRGLNIKNARPDVILMDDIQSREAADSDIESRKIERWMQGTVLKAKSNKGVLVIFVGNMYPTPNSLLKKLKDNRIWEKVISGGILVQKDGTVASLWEEVRSLESLLQEYELDKAAGQEEVFFAEVLNDENAVVNGLVDISKIPQLPFDPDISEAHAGSFIVIDPATGKKNKDNIAIGYFQLHEARPVLWELINDRLNPMKVVQETLKVCSRTGCRLVFVESVAYQATLAFWFRYFINRLGIEGIQIIEIYPGRASKTSRILNMFKQLTGHPTGKEPGVPEVLLHPRVRVAVLDQIRSFDYLRTDNVDDVLDVLTYATPIVTKYEALIRISSPLEMQAMTSSEISSYTYTEAENSAF